MAGQTPGEDRRREGGKSNTGGGSTKQWHVERGRHGSKRGRHVGGGRRRDESSTTRRTREKSTTNQEDMEMQFGYYVGLCESWVER